MDIKERQAMFESSQFETAGHLESHLGLATATSITLQCFMMAVLILVPLAYTDVLPTQELVAMLVAPPPPPPPPPAPAAAAAPVKAHESEVLASGKLLTPTKIPDRIEMIKDDEPAAGGSNGVIGGVPGGVPGGQLSGVIGGIVDSTPTPIFLPKVRVVAPVRVRVSEGVSEGMLTSQVMPVYPQMAKVARISGNVVLEAVISKDGSVQNVRLVSGHPLLVPAAIAAVQQWKYRPYLLNHDPVEVETVITVKFVMSR
jgi:protein TonB